MKKRFLTILLAVAMVFTTTPYLALPYAYAFADDEAVVVENEGGTASEEEVTEEGSNVTDEQGAKEDQVTDADTEEPAEDRNAGHVRNRRKTDA